MSSKPRSEATTQALSALIGQQPFFAVLAFNLCEIQETEDLPTAATDGKRIYINPKFMASLTVPERIFVFAHEITHVILQHPQRMKLYMDMGYGPDMKEWSGIKFNKAADYVINDYLNHLTIGKQPLNTLLNGQYGRDDLVDDVYCKLPDEPDDPNGKGNGWDKHMPAADDAADKDVSKAEIQRAVKQAEAAQKAMGSMPAGLQRLIDDVCEPQVNWKDHIERTILTIYGNDEASWGSVNRRRIGMAPHVPWPGKVGMAAGSVGIVIDTSGSIGDKELSLFMGEVKGVLENVMPEKICLMYIDAALHNDTVHEFDDVSELAHVAQQAGGGGGTNMPLAFQIVEEREIDIQCMIILTDGYTPFGEDPGYPVIWCCTTANVEAPWGTTIHVKL